MGCASSAVAVRHADGQCSTRQPDAGLQIEETETPCPAFLRVSGPDTVGEGERSGGLVSFCALRKYVIGQDATFCTPYGERMLLYADYTASGRLLALIENYLLYVTRVYANAHTEDSVTGACANEYLAAASRMCLESVHAGPEYEVLFVGSGSTAAIYRLQQIMGIALNPAAAARIAQDVLGLRPESHSASPCGSDGSCLAEIRARIEEQRRPLVFVTSMEHHSNELSWREGLCDVVNVGLTDEGEVDLADLEAQLRQAQGRRDTIIGSFSACSNVTGLINPVRALADLMHSYGGLAFFDYSASAPYVNIDMDSDGLDGVVFSPHKFLGGVGGTGVLILRRSLYRQDLPPTVAGGGTVDYVTPVNHRYTDDLATRESAGTPALLSNLRVGLACGIKSAIGVDRIEEKESAMLAQAFERWCGHPNLVIYGTHDATKRIPIVSFNIRHPRASSSTTEGAATGDDHSPYIHPKLVTVLADSLFGVETRAGCSCAGVYGHMLLGISQGLSQRYQHVIEDGWLMVKPGWVRVGFHYSMDEEDVRHIIDTVLFLADHAHLFLHLYRAHMRSGEWEFIDGAALSELQVPRRADDERELDTGGVDDTVAAERIEIIRRAHALIATRAQTSTPKPAMPSIPLQPSKSPGQTQLGQSQSAAGAAFSPTMKNMPLSTASMLFFNRHHSFAANNPRPVALEARAKYHAQYMSTAKQLADSIRAAEQEASPAASSAWVRFRNPERDALRFFECLHATVL